jgi:hypothetical protein
MKAAYKAVLWILLVIFLSAASVLSPIAFLQKKNVFDMLYQHGVAAIGDAINPIATAILFFFSGCVVGGLAGGTWLGKSALVLAIFPAIVMAEVIAGIGHHNLFPFEVAVYVILALPTLAGAAATAALRRAWAR